MLLLHQKFILYKKVQDGKYEVYFGDGINGIALSDGNIVILEYIVTNKTVSNSASSFSLSGNIGGFSNVTITTVSSSQGGSEAKQMNQLDIMHLYNMGLQDRAVTTTDYETLVKSIYPNALSVSAWGGEDDETPRYGIVKIGVKAAQSSTLTETTKQSIVDSLKPYNVASVSPQIVDPEITSVLLTSTVNYDSSSTTKSSRYFKSEIINIINKL